MKTTKAYKDRFIAQGSEIEENLLRVFGDRDQSIHIADIGACDGLHTIIYARLFRKATLYAFEPVAENLAEAKENWREYGVIDRVVEYPYALGTANLRRQFFKSYGEAPGVTDTETGNKSGSLLRPKKHLQEHKWCKFTQDWVDERRLDDLRDGPERIDFAHIDVQGYELNVLRGGKKAFSGTKAFWIEVANIDLYAGQPLKHQIAEYMRQRGYVCILDTCGTHKYGDMLWVKK